MTEPTPTPTPVPQDVLVAVRRLHERGLIDKLTPEKRAKALAILESEFKVEREDALKPKAELLSREPKAGNFVDELLAPVRSAVNDPFATALSAVRGAERSFNVLSLGGVDVEEIESAFSMPIIRGAELAARLFVPDDQQPDLTTFSEVVKNQRDMDKSLRNVAPGWQEGTEGGIALASGAQLATSGMKLAAAVARRAPGAARALGQRVAAKLADRSLRKTQKLSKELLRVGEGDPALLDAIVSRPERVEQAIKSSGVSLDDAVLRLRDEAVESLEEIGGNLGKRVGEFREAAFADTATRIKVPQEVSQGIGILRNRTTINLPNKAGAIVKTSVLPSHIDRKLQMAEKMSSLGVTSPNQAMVWVDTLDDIIDYGNAGKEGSNIVKASGQTLLAIRNQLKGVLRESKAGDAWATADELFSGFAQSSNGVIRKLQSETSSQSFVANLLGRNKTSLRANLEKSLDYAEALDPLAKGEGAAFTARLADIKAAERIQQVMTPDTGQRVSQEITHEIIRRWTKRGELAGMAIGSPVGALAGKIGMGGGSGAGLGFGIGVVSSKSIGGMVGEAVGRRMADPMRVIAAAKKAKNLSAKAKQLATDMETIVSGYGPAGAVAFLDLVGPIPAVKELIQVGSTVRAGLNKDKEGK